MLAIFSVAFHTGPTHLQSREQCRREPGRQLLSTEAFHEVWDSAVNKFRPSWPVKIAAIVLAAHQEGRTSPIGNCWRLACSLFLIMMGDDRCQPRGHRQGSVPHMEGLRFVNFLEAAQIVRGCVL